jgi:hypothetical protein
MRLKIKGRGLEEGILWQIKHRAVSVVYIDKLG